MKIKFWIPWTLFLMLVGAVFAVRGQETPPLNETSQALPAEPLPPLGFPIEKGYPPHSALKEMTAQSIEGTNINLGQPGLSFRYVQTFGVTQEPFIETNDHFYWVEGVGTIGNSIWIADTWGHRVVKFDSSRNYIKKVGKAGVMDYTDTSLDHISDVAEDSSGNVWVVDSGAHHVVKFDTNGEIVMELGELWNEGSTNDLFNDPMSIAFDSAGNIYVSDSDYWDANSGNNRIQIFYSTGNYRATIGGISCGSGNTQLCLPRRIAIYGNFLYVADAGNHRVQIFNISNPSSPAYHATLGLTGNPGSANDRFNSPEGVAVDASYIYVADTENHRVQIFNRNTLDYVATIGGSFGSSNNQFKYPTDVAVDSSGNIYVADYANKRVQQFNSSRVYQRTYGTTGDSYQETNDRFYNPEGVAVASDGSIYIVEGTGYRLVKLNAAGVPQWTFGEAGQPGNDDNHFTYLNDVAVDPQGRVYTVEGWASSGRIGGNHRLRIFNSDGTPLRIFGGYGSDNDKFIDPRGIAIDRNGNVYIADSGNHRVQIYNNQLQYVATLGITEEPGTDNAHFDSPFDVAVDANGIIYVADEGNDRVQVFNANRQYVRTIGGGGTGSDFGRFSGWGPHRLAVDSQGRLYVVDSGNQRLQVFDNFANGNAYLTTIGGAWGTQAGRFSNILGVAIGPGDTVYTTETDNNHRVQKFAPGVPGWKQVNINGFGELWNTWISSLVSFKEHLYVSGYQAYVWRLENNGSWSSVSDLGFGDDTNVEIDAMAVFKDHLYAATFTFVCDDPDCDTWHTNGPQFWRTADGTTWQNVTPSGSIGSDYRWVPTMFATNDYLYAALDRGNLNLLGAEVWRTTDGVNWQKIASGGFDDPYNTGVLSLVEYNGNLYAGTRHGDWQDDAHPDGPLGGEVWRYDGTTWSQANDPGFGDVKAHRVERLFVFKDALYAYISRVVGTSKGAEIWRCTASVCNGQADWTKVVDNGFGNPDNQYIFSGVVFDGYLYAAVANYDEGVQIWRTADGSQWEKITADPGFGDSNNTEIWLGAMAVNNNRLFVGTTNWANGGEVWLFLHNRLFLPLVLR